MNEDEPPVFSNIAKIRDAIQTGEHGMSVEEAQQILNDEKKRIEQIDKDRYLDPLHVQTPMLQRIQREFPNLNSGAGSANWIVLANTANLITALRTKDISSKEIEHEIKENIHRLFGVLYKQGLIKKS